MPPSLEHSSNPEVERGRDRLSSPHLIAALAGVAGCSLIAVTGLAALVPLVVALPSALSSTPWWTVVAPLAGALAATAVIVGRRRAGDLPGQVLFAYAGCAIAVLLLGTLLGDDPLLRVRRLATVLTGSSLLLASALLLRAVVHAPLLADLARTAAKRAGNQRRARSLVVYAIRPSLIATTVTLAAICFGLISGHAMGRSAAAREQLDARLQRDLHAAATMLQAPPGQHRHRQLVAKTAKVDRRATAAPSPKLGQLLLLLGLALAALAALIGWTMGSDIRHTFRSINDQLGDMIGAVEPTFHRPLLVSSIDEAGELTAGVDRLRLQLEGDLASYRSSLQRTHEAEQRKRQFISDIDEVLRSPLTTIREGVQQLIDGSAGPLSDAQQEDLRVIDSGGKQLLDLLGDVLDLSIIESGSMALDLQPVQAASLVDDALKGQRAAITGLTLQLKSEIPDGLPPLLADRRRLRQVIDNLLGNALRFTEQGSVTVRITHDKDDALIEVEDTGSGISALELPRIFDAYRQAGTRSDKRGGSGLGLAICRRIIEQHGGSISARSEVGSGTCFSIRWPLHQEGSNQEVAS